MAASKKIHPESAHLPRYHEGALAPVVLMTLFHVHAIAEPLPVPEAPATIASLNVLVKHELIESVEEASSGWGTTSRGKAYVKMLCAMPFPIPDPGWSHPLTKELIPR